MNLKKGGNLLCDKLNQILDALKAIRDFMREAKDPIVQILFYAGVLLITLTACWHFFQQLYQQEGHIFRSGQSTISAPAPLPSPRGQNDPTPETPDRPEQRSREFEPEKRAPRYTKI